MKMEIDNVPNMLNKENSILERPKTSKFRIYASQIYATSATNIVKFENGLAFGFTSVVIADLLKENSEIHMSVSEISWFSSYCFMVPVGCLFLGLLAQRMGARLTMLISTIFYITSFLLFYFATDSAMLLVAIALAGFISTTAVGPGITYVVEITQPQLRSSLTASTTLSMMIASFLVVFMSNFLHWRIIALVMLIFPITSFIAIYPIPESPHWLASKNRFLKAEAALCWLRGWSTPQSVESEFKALQEIYASPSHNLDSPQKNFNSNRWGFFKDNISFYLRRSFYVPVALICLLFVLQNCHGYNPLVVYSIVIFRQINAPIDPHVAASIYDGMRILGAIVCMLIINYTGKKKLVYFTLTGAALSNITTSTALLLNDYQIYPEACKWIATITMMCTTFLTSAGIDKIVYILNAEIFPTHYRNVGAGVGLFTATIAQAISSKLFIPLLEAVTLSGVFAIYGISCITTCTMVHFAFPETEGKTLQEIERHYESAGKLKRNVTVDKIHAGASSAKNS